MSDEPKIETISSTLVYESPWLKVRHDEVQFADGSFGVYNIVERGDFVAVIALDDDGSIYLVEQFRYGSQSRMIELPMGGVDAKFGPEPIDSARGELLEETGMLAAEMIAVGRMETNASYMRQTLHIFLATGLEKREQALEPGELGLTVHRLPISEVEQLIRDGRLTNEHTMAAFCLARLKGMI